MGAQLFWRLSGEMDFELAARSDDSARANSIEFVLQFQSKFATANILVDSTVMSEH